MTVPLRIAGINLADSAVVTASSSVSTLPPDQTQLEDVQALWRAGSTTAWLLADLGSSVAVSVAALINSNAIAADTKQVRLSTVDATGAAGDAYDSGVVASGVDPTYRRLVHFIEPAATGRYLRIDLAQSAVPEAGRLVIASAWTPSRHFSYGWQPMSRDWSRRSRSLGQTLFFDQQPRQRGVRFTLRGLTSAEVDSEIEPLNRLNGTSADILVCRDATAANLGAVTIWGVMERSIAYTQTNPDFFTAEFVLWERL